MYKYVVFNGQWYQLVVRDGQDRPLTILRFQKDAYSKVKKMSIAQQLLLFDKPMSPVKVLSHSFNLTKMNNEHESDRRSRK